MPNDEYLKLCPTCCNRAKNLDYGTLVCLCAYKQINEGGVIMGTYHECRESFELCQGSQYMRKV
jgi:hypothetical protein